MRPLRLGACLGVTALATGLLLVLKSGTEAGLAVQFLLGKLAYSTSDGAAVYVLGALVACVWRLHGTQYAGPVRRSALMTLGSALVLGHALNLWLTLRYLSAMHIPLGNHVYHWTDSSYSFTGLFHSHLGKTGFAIVSAAIGWQPAGYDTGGVFLPWVPAWAAWLLAASFVAGWVALLAALPGMARRNSGPHVLVFAMAGALTLRGMVDGGPLASGLPPLFVALAWVCRPAWMSGRAFLACAMGVTGSYLALWVSLVQGLPALGDFLIPLLLMVWLVLAGQPRPWRRWMMPLRVLLVSLLAGLVALDGSENLLPLVSPLPPGCHVVRVLADPVGKVAPGDEVDTTCAGKTAFAVYRDMGEDPRKPRRTLLTPSPVPGSHALSTGLLIIDTRRENVSPLPSAAWPQIALAPLTGAGGWLSVSARGNANWPAVQTAEQPNALSRNNYNVYLWEMARLLQRGGLSEFVLMPRTQGNQAEP